MSDRTTEQRAEVAAFVDWLYAQSGCDTWAEYARKADVHWASISKWHRAINIPDGFNLLQLIRAAGGMNAKQLRAVPTPGNDVRQLLLTVEGMIEAATSSPEMAKLLGPALSEVGTALRDLATELDRATHRHTDPSTREDER